MLRISLSHSLPPRPRAATWEQLHNVFGGCTNAYGVCWQSGDCCPPANFTSFDFCVNNRCAGGTTGPLGGGIIPGFP